MELIIRQARPGDARGVVDIFNPIIETGLYSAFDTPFSIEEEREYIVNLSQRDIFNVALRGDDEKIVGFQSLSPFLVDSGSFAHVGMIGTYVDLTLRRQGIARALFPVTLAEARTRGYEKIFTFVRADNPGALATYMSQGFRIVGTAQKQAKIKGNYIDEIIIERFL